MDVDADKVYFLFIKNTGTSDTSNTTTTNSVYVTLDDNDSTAYNTPDAIEIAAGEAWMFRSGFGVIADTIHIISAQAKGAGTADTVNDSADVRCTVVAVLNDAA